MFDFEAPLFWYKMVFMAELLISEGLTTYTLKKKPLFALRVVLCMLGCEAAAFLYPLYFGAPAFNAVYSSFMFLLLFGCTLAAIKICYNEPWVNVLFCGIIAYTTQHIAYETYNFIVSATGMQGFGDVYTEGGIVQYNLITTALWFGVYGVIYWLVWAFIAYRIRKQDNLKVDNIPLLFFSGVIVAIDIVLNAVVTYTTEKPAMSIYTILFIYNLLSCSLAIGLQFSMLGKRIAETELKTVQSLWIQDKKLYEMSKENVELINVKCHDLKHQLRALRNADGEVDKAAIKEIESAVSIYDGAVKTGCDVLDVILAEKSLYCEKHGIRLTAIADGEKLNFMSKPDLYSLFGNAVSNAIEAVTAIDDQKQRLIRLRIDTTGGLISVHVENTCAADKLRFVGDLPQTTQDDKYHGYGVRSMQLIAEKYGGGLSISVTNGMFNLDVIIPFCQSG